MSLGAATVRAVGKRKLISSKQALVLTQNAVGRLKELLSENPNKTAVKVGVKQRGCNGMSYTLDYADKKEKFDEEVEQDGVKLYIDMKAQMTLLGTEMDFVKTKLSSEFVFNNPNIKGTCGCGESFNM